MPGSLLTGKFAHFSGQCAPIFHIFHRRAPATASRGRGRMPSTSARPRRPGTAAEVPRRAGEHVGGRAQRGWPRNRRSRKRSRLLKNKTILPPRVRRQQQAKAGAGAAGRDTGAAAAADFSGSGLQRALWTSTTSGGLDGGPSPHHAHRPTRASQCRGEGAADRFVTPHPS
jgi:hypothetical protein